jgi:hypothetical protein
MSVIAHRFNHKRDWSKKLRKLNREISTADYRDWVKSIVA